MTPVTTTIGISGGVWTIPNNPVTVTFPERSVDFPVVFTFAPKTGHSPAPPGRSSYHFDLRGVYSGTTTEVSMKRDYEVAVQYDPSELDGADELCRR